MKPNQHPQPCHVCGKMVDCGAGVFRQGVSGCYNQYNFQVFHPECRPDKVPQQKVQKNVKAAAADSILGY